MFHLSPIILNDQEAETTGTEGPIDVALTVAMADLKTGFIDPEKGLVHYERIRDSQAFDRYKSLANGLRSFDLRSLERREQRIAFWINIYNTAVIHGVIELGISRSVKEVPGFFHRITYTIGGYDFSLDEIEHGILRANRRPPYRLFRPFSKKDPRLEFIVNPPDLRIHFALVCGAKSCPPISFYEADQVDFQLQLAAMSFINSPQVKVLPEERSVLISRIFEWYRSDFMEGGRDLIHILLEYLDESEKKAFLRENSDRIRIKYQPYDWNLNQ